MINPSGNKPTTSPTFSSSDSLALDALGDKGRGVEDEGEDKRGLPWWRLWDKQE